MKQILRTLLVAAALIATPLAIYAALPAPGSHDSIEVTASSGSLRLQATGDKPVVVAVFSITGQRVKQLTVEPGETVSLDLPAGYYIVKTPDGSHRVLVK